MAKLALSLLATFVASYVSQSKIAVDSYTETRDNSVGLLDTLGKIYTNWQNYKDKLLIFDGEELSYGKTIEEWAQDLIMPQTADPTGANTLAPHESTYRPVSFSYTLGKVTIPQTIRNNDIERAVHNIAQFSDVIAGKTKAMYDSETLLRYQIKRASSSTTPSCFVKFILTHPIQSSTVGSKTSLFKARSTISFFNPLRR